MLLSDYLSVQQIDLDLEGDTKEEILRALLGLLPLGDRSRDTLLRTLRRRENLGSTGIGRGIAIPHCRSLVVNRLHLAYGRRLDGVDFEAIDGRPVSHFFLIVAPPLEVSGQYLPVLGKVAQFARDPEVPAMLESLTTPDELLDLFEAKGI
ncbi:MAG: PTS sugar transporter subunit IIA [Gemmatimonadota bacterium]|nr:PTS sugar transporter subunit IIA [Gemmatimonadota bacterium]MDE2784124.1 PTS sugar transporter subunit IIA [Gemmatimonadota bacterium]MDE2863596.1 PTS sugar transporter subunit IIA [Gemmatimonadota bacterium]